MTKDISELRPTTIEGIKALAKRIKKRDAIQHAKALDVAAQQAGFENYRHALATLGDASL